MRQPVPSAFQIGLQTFGTFIMQNPSARYFFNDFGVHAMTGAHPVLSGVQTGTRATPDERGQLLPWSDSLSVVPVSLWAGEWVKKSEPLCENHGGFVPVPKKK